MKQLLMVWRKTPIQMSQIPEGYRFHNWRRGGDEILSAEAWTEQWLDLHDPDHTQRETFVNWLPEVYDDIRVPDDGFFTVLTEQNALVATACIQLGEHTPESATVHAVCASRDHKGKNLGRIVTVAVVEYAKRLGIDEVYLTTDDWRIPAVKIYLDLGFVPVYWDEDMRERWGKLFDLLGRKNVTVIDENGNDEIINAE